MRCPYFLISAILALVAQQSSAQQLLATPNFEFKSSGTINDVFQEPDGHLLIGGEFTEVDGVPRANLARLNADGSLDTNWQMDVTGPVYEFEARGDGAIYVAGGFTAVAGQQRFDLALLTPGANGPTLDAWSLSAPVVFDLAALANGDLIVVTSNLDVLRYVGAAGQPQENFAGIPLSALVTNVEATNDRQSVIACGNTGVYRVTQANVVTWHRSEFNSWCYGLNRLSDDAVLAAYEGPPVPGAYTTNVRKLAANGADVPGWNVALNGGVTGISVTPSGEAWLMSYQTMGVPDSITTKNRIRGLITRVSAAGVVQPRALNVTGWASKATFLNANLSLITGGMHTANSVLRPGSFKVDAAMVPVDVPAPRILRAKPQVYAAKQLQSGDTLVTGNFIEVNGVERRFMLRLAPDMSLRADAWPFDTAPGLIAEDSQGDCYLGNAFVLAPSVSSSSILKLAGCGAIDPGYLPAASKFVTAMAVADSGLFIATCDQDHDLYEQVCQLQRYAKSGVGSLLPTWTTMANAQIRSLATQDGALYVGGQFWEFDGIAREGVARVSNHATGATDPVWFPSIRPFETFRILPTANGELILSGKNAAAAPSISPLLKITTQIAQAVPDWEPTRSVEQTLGWSWGETGDTELQSDGSLLASRLRFGSVERAPAFGAVTKYDDDFVIHANNAIYDTEYLGNDRVLIVGSFTTALGQPRNGIALVGGTHRWVLQDSFE